MRALQEETVAKRLRGISDHMTKYVYFTKGTFVPQHSFFAMGCKFVILQ